MILLSTNWATAWLMTGIGLGVVFCILILLVFILQIFNATVASSTGKKTASAPSKQKETAAQSVAEPASEDEKAAVAMAIYLYFRNVHDEESNVLTIQPASFSSWHAVLNTRL